MKAAISTLGCKVNQYDSQLIKENLIENGYEITTTDNIADIYIINSCTVTSISDQKSRSLVSRFKSRNPNAIIILTGCMPQAYPNKSSDIHGADIILGNKNYNKLPEIIEEFLKNNHKISHIDEHAPNSDLNDYGIKSFHERSRAIVKIEEGCDRFCSYCIIPYARGNIRSRSADSIIKELLNLSKTGYKEIVLVGINLTAYGKDLGTSLADVIESASSVDGIERIRLGSLEPNYIDGKLLNRLAQHKKLCPHFHISLQSGCAATLKRMNRSYDPDQFESLCLQIRDTFDNPAITTDIMVGFPGETDDEFQKSLSFVKKMNFSRSHVFAYSRREGTAADKMDNQITSEIKKSRSRIMIAETDKLKYNFLQSQIGLISSALIETNKNDVFVGYTSNYTPVKIKSASNIQGQIIDVKILSVDNNYCYGVTVN